MALCAQCLHKEPFVSSTEICCSIVEMTLHVLFILPIPGGDPATAGMDYTGLVLARK